MIELRRVIDTGEKLETSHLSFGSTADLIKEITQCIDSNTTCFLEVTTDDEPKVSLAYSGGVAHLGLWKNCEEPVYILNTHARLEEVIDIGWNSFPASNTTTEIETLISSIELFLNEGIFSSDFEWVDDGE